MGGYFRFIATIRAQVTEETGKKGIALTPYFAKAWNAMDDAQKEKFNKQTAKEMPKYKKKLAAYKKTDSFKKFQDEKRRKKLRSKKPKDINAPKRPASAYFLFANEVRPAVMKQNPNGGIAVFGKAIGAMWGKMDESKKASYVQKASVAREKWQTKVAAYKKTAKYAAYLNKVAEYKAKVKAQLSEEKMAAKEVEAAA